MDFENEMMFQMLGFDRLSLNFPVTVEGFDGECFTYSVYFADGISDEEFARVDEAIKKYLTGFSEDDYPVYVSVEKKAGKAYVFLDLGSSEDCDRYIQGIILAINEVAGVTNVVINEK